MPNSPEADRITRLEEALAFSERTVEQLSVEIAEINRRLAETGARLQRLERRLDSALAPGGEAPEPDTPES